MQGASDCNSESFISTVLESQCYTAGDTVTGEIILNMSGLIPQSNLYLIAQGNESISVSSHSGRPKNYVNEIFHTSVKIHTWTSTGSKGQYSFPFTFKLPYYCPSTFEFSGTDAQGFSLEAHVRYMINVRLDTDSWNLLEDCFDLTINNSETRKKVKKATEEMQLRSCCCFKKGRTFISLSHIVDDHPAYGDNVRFKLDVDWKKSKGKITEITGKVRYSLQLTLPGDRNYEFSYELYDFMHSNSFLQQDDNFQMVNEFDVNILMQGNLNVASNNTAMISSVYSAEAMIVFDLGVNKEIRTLSMPVHVSPKLPEERKIRLPSDWEADCSSLVHIFLQSRTGQFIFSPTKPSIGLTIE